MADSVKEPSLERQNDRWRDALMLSEELGGLPENLSDWIAVCV